MPQSFNATSRKKSIIPTLLSMITAAAQGQLIRWNPKADYPKRNQRDRCKIRVHNRRRNRIARRSRAVNARIAKGRRY
jgi:hypothetical protein